MQLQKHPAQTQIQLQKQPVQTFVEKLVGEVDFAILHKLQTSIDCAISSSQRGSGVTNRGTNTLDM